MGLEPIAPKGNLFPRLRAANSACLSIVLVGHCSCEVLPDKSEQETDEKGFDEA